MIAHRVGAVAIVLTCFVATCTCPVEAGRAAESGSTGPHLEEKDALKIADEFVMAQFGQDAHWLQRWYPHRSATHEPKTRTWRVFYNREPGRHPGDHFLVRIDELSGEVKLVGGA